MEKTAFAFFYPVMKSIPINSKPRTPKQLRDYLRKPLILRSYTLCEVVDGEEQSLPLENPAGVPFCISPENCYEPLLSQKHLPECGANFLKKGNCQNQDRQKAGPLNILNI